MLIATPYRDFDVRDKSPPKVISEVRKTYLNCAGPNLRPKLTGELLIKTPLDKLWHRRRTQIRGGQLHVSPVVPLADDQPSITAIRLPLRHLSLQAGPLGHSLALCRGQNVVLMLQTGNEQIFDEWVKTIAIELIRQTPLDAIKYLDILTLAESCNQRKQDKIHAYQENGLCYSRETFKQKNQNIEKSIHNSLDHLGNQKVDKPIENYADSLFQSKKKSYQYSNSKPLWNQSVENPNQHLPLTSRNEPEQEKLTKDYNQNVLLDEVDATVKSTCQACTKHDELFRKNEGSISKGVCLAKLQEPKTSIQQTDQEKLVESLLKKCQNSENYVPVKEKLVLFESLCKIGRKVRSTEDVSLKPETTNTKRAKSLHDLSNINTHIAVREICKYFENKNEDLGTTDEKNVLKSTVVKRLNFEKCNSNTENLYKFQKVIVM